MAFYIGSTKVGARFIDAKRYKSTLYIGTTKICPVLIDGEKHKITLVSSVSGLEITYTANEKTSTALEETSGHYVMYVYGEDEIVNYFVNGNGTYDDINGTVISTNEDMTIPIKLISWGSWSRPNLTANGIIGSSDFAVTASVNDTDAYKAVDDSNTTTWYVAKSSGMASYIFYNPSELKLSRLTLRKRTMYAYPTFSLYGSNDNINWTQFVGLIKSTYNDATTVNLSSNLLSYKYHKLDFNISNAVDVLNLDITAKQKIET